MRPPEGQNAAEGEMLAAEAALAGHRYREALQHLAEAERLGATDNDVEHLRAAVRQAQATGNRRVRRSGWVGLAVGLLGYLLLSAEQPPGWTVPGWIFLAFLVVPGVVGLATGRLQGWEQPPGARFRAAMRAGGIAMALYTGFTLIVLRQRIHTNTDSGQIFLAGCLVTLVYAVLAGLVAGFVSARLAWRGERSRSA